VAGSRKVSPVGEPGNVLAMVHGATSERVVAPVARKIVEEVLAVAPYLHDPAYRNLLDVYAATLARHRLLEAHVAKRGMVNRRGRTYGTTDLLMRHERSVLELARELGLTPRARAALGRDVAAGAVDAARVWSGLEPAPSARRRVPTATPDAPHVGDTVPGTGAREPSERSGGTL